jgi:hypothetical protein
MNRKLTLITLVGAFLTSTIGYATAQDGRRYDNDDYRYQHNYDRDDYRHDFRQGMRLAQDLGYRDGREVAREDSWRGKPFNPNPRGHNHADRGYRREFGSRHEYREQYAQAYHEGYESSYRDDDRRGYYR